MYQRPAKNNKTGSGLIAPLALPARYTLSLAKFSVAFQCSISVKLPHEQPDNLMPACL
jgi:hypothetical protein